MRKMGIKLAAATIFLLFLLVCAQSVFVVAGGKWYYWMEPGAYAKYTYFQRQEVPWHDCFYFVNESMAGFTNFTLAWMVTDVHDLYATVDYNLTFYGAKVYTTEYLFFGPYVEVGNLTFNTSLTVRLDTLELVDDGEPWGRWPYWVHGWEIGKNITMIHNYLPSPNWMGHVGDEPVNVTVSLSPVTKGEIDTPVYNFSAERLLLRWTHFLTKEKIGNVTAVTWATHIDAFYDSVSLICLDIYTQEIADDVLYHKFGVWDVIYVGDVLLVETNINFEPSETPEEAPTVSVWLVAGVIAVVALPILGITLQLRRKRKGKAA